ncbi:MAG: UDP-N-acetylglucosamine 2-epimerase, partial [Planctomycetota bacterium]|nr:UDP-N-acetylglucosamine 2-epimerase [Planctomycetota bacterium]
ERGGGTDAGPWVAVAGTRPNYVKLAPLVRAARRVGHELFWIDAGQHTDHAMQERIRLDAGLPEARVSIQAPPPGPERIEGLAATLEVALRELAPSVVLVVGDVDATAAAALAAWRLDLPLAHVEAGLRCGVASMPEERNRVLVDALSDRYYTTEPSAHRHLASEGLGPDRYAVEVGNVMADALLHLEPSLASAGPEADVPADYVLATLHRQANVDDPARLGAYVRALGAIAREHGSVVWPVHPRTAARLDPALDLRALGITARAPVGYRAFLGLLAGASAVVTDSGGVQVEAALLGTPCVVARGVTEHELSLSHGGAVLAGEDPAALPAALPEALAQVLAAGTAAPERPVGWDGHAAARIVADLARGFARPPRRAMPTDRGA